MVCASALIIFIIITKHISLLLFNSFFFLFILDIIIINFFTAQVLIYSRNARPILVMKPREKAFTVGSGNNGKQNIFKGKKWGAQMKTAIDTGT